MYNLVDETSSTAAPRFANYQNPNLASTASLDQNPSSPSSSSSTAAAQTETTAPVPVNHRAESLPATDSSSSFLSYSGEDRTATTITITPPPPSPTTIANTNTAGLRCKYKLKHLCPSHTTNPLNCVLYRFRTPHHTCCTPADLSGEWCVQQR